MVTGGAGFIGANLCIRLASVDEVSEVIAYDDLSTGKRSNLDSASEKVRFVEGSVLDPALIGRRFDGAAAIVHLAARPSVPRSIEDPIASHRVNVDGTMNVLEFARAATTAPHVIFASSSSVYGSNPELPKHEGLSTRPRSPYAASKLAGEAYTLAYQDSFGIPVLPFRFFNVYGPLQAPGHAYAAVVPAFLHAALNDAAVTVHGDGEQTRDFTHVDTVTSVIVDAVLRQVTSDLPVNLAFGTRHSLLGVLELLEELLDRPVEREHVSSRQGDVRDSQASSDLLRSMFQDIDPIGLHDGLMSTLAWMRSIV